MSQRKSLIFLTLTICLLNGSWGECPSGWFGDKCQYQCHCDKGCTDDGNCVDGFCSHGWFGEFCQYQDLIAFYNATASADPEQWVDYLIDGVDGTCVTFSLLSNITVSFRRPIPFTFLRIRAIDVKFLHVTMTFITAHDTEEECKNMSRKLVMSPNLIDYYCHPSATVTNITLSLQNVEKMCSIYVSGGRNLALGQTVQQSTTHTPVKYAIDGVKSSLHYKFPCTHTLARDTNAHLNLTYEVPVVINRIILYNRGDNLSARLNKFNLRLYNEYDMLLYEYNDNSVEENQLVYTVLLPVLRPVRLLVIRATNIFKGDYPVLTICELETFGDCPSYVWGLICFNGCSDSCFLGCSAMDGSCDYILTESDSRCAIGWFGPNCRYKCHCAHGCDREGNCHNSTCRSGWFGHLCQYQNLLTPEFSEVSTSRFAVDLLVDERDDTCTVLKEKNAKISVRFDYPVMLSFIRFHSKSAKSLDVSVHFKKPSTCDNRNRALIVGGHNVDIYCHLNDTVRGLSLTLNGPVQLCSLYVSGGRNLAYGQHVVESSMVRPPHSTFASAFKAIDGFKLHKFYRRGCTHTGPNDTHPHFNLTFDAPVNIQRIVLYNRESNNRRLLHFIIVLFNAQDRKLVEYQDKSNVSSLVYSLLFPDLQMPVWRVQVRATHIEQNDVNPVLTLCEVEAFGDCIPGTWDLDCNKTCAPSCNKLCSSMDGSCHITCMDGTTPPDCHAAICPAGLYGPKCSSKCSTRCFNVSCDSKTGHCLQGCMGYRDPPYCTVKCDSQHYGLNCNLTCHDSCWNRSCNHLNGACEEGCYGYSNPPTCDLACSIGTYGDNCEHVCTQCLQKRCHHVTGICTFGCVGFLDFPVCSQSCPKGRYGVNCTSKCSAHCYKRLCNVTTGHCDYGCEGFRDPPRCNIPCSETHGFNCSCQPLCKECQNFTSVCSQCKTGYHHDRLNNICSIGNTPLHSISNEKGETSNSNLIPLLYLALALCQTLIGVWMYARRRLRWKKTQTSRVSSEGSES